MTWHLKKKRKRNKKQKYTMHSTAVLQSCSFKVCVLLIQLKGHNMKYHSSTGHMTSRDTILQV